MSLIYVRLRLSASGLVKNKGLPQRIQQHIAFLRRDPPLGHHLKDGGALLLEVARWIGNSLLFGRAGVGLRRDIDLDCVASGRRARRDWRDWRGRGARRGRRGRGGPPTRPPPAPPPPPAP